MLNIIPEGRAKKDSVIYLGPYGRVSTDMDDQKNSLLSQQKFFSKMIGKTPGLKIFDEYYDDGISGTSLKKRDQFNRMMTDARSGKLDVIVTKEVSRFARNTVDVLVLTRELKEKGIQVIFLSDGINTFDKDGELRLSIMATLAQDESRKTSERVKWGQTRRMEQGVVFGRSMLGYDVKDGKMTVNPEGAKVVTLIYQKYLNEGLGAFRIARDLEEAGVPTYHGDSRWTPKVIYTILRNEKYAGDLEQKKTYTPDFLSHEKKYNHGAEEKVLIKDHHQPIINRETWNAVQAEIRRRGRLISQEQRGKHSNAYWCSGKLGCAICGAPLMRRVKKLRDGGERRSWRCGEAVRFGMRKYGTDGKPVGCDARAVNELVLKDCVFKCFQCISYNEEKLVKEIVSEIRAVQERQNPYSLIKLEKGIIKLEKKKIRAVQLLVDGEISNEEWKLVREVKDREIKQLQALVVKAKESELHQENRVMQIEKYTEMVRKILQGENTVQNENERFLGELLDQVLIYSNGEVEVKLEAVPFSIRLQYVAEEYGKGYTIRVEHWAPVCKEK